MTLFKILNKRSGFWLPEDMWDEIAKQYYLLKDEHQIRYNRFVASRRNKYLIKNGFHSFLQGRIHKCLVSKKQHFITILSEMYDHSIFDKFDENYTVTRIFCYLKYNTKYKKTGYEEKCMYIMIPKNNKDESIMKWIMENLETKYNMDKNGKFIILDYNHKI